MVILDNPLALKARDIMDDLMPIIDLNTSISEAIEKMRSSKLGALIICSGQGNKKVYKILTQNELITILQLLTTKASKPDVKLMDIIGNQDLILKPLVIVNSDEKITDLIKIFVHEAPPIVGVSHKGRLVGIITVKRILEYMDNLLDYISNLLKFRRKIAAVSNRYVSGYCEQCGRWSDKLRYIDGRYYCPDCIIDLYGREI